MKQSAPYGSWKSPITAEFVSGKDRNLNSSLQVDGDHLYFLESRPDEGGRTVLMILDSKQEAQEVLPKEFNVRSRYLEYGARSFLAAQGHIYFVHFADQQIYVRNPQGEIKKLTQENDNRFADFVVDAPRQRLIALREVLAKPESKNTICSIDLKTGAVFDLLSGADFYNCPRLSADSQELLWISWNHPNMAWNGTELWKGQWDQQGKIHQAKKIAGDQTHGVCQGQWGKKGEIYFIAELEEWFNLYCYQDGQIKNLFPQAAEFAFPDWNPGLQQYAVGPDALYASFLKHGHWQLVKLQKGQSELIGTALPEISSLYAYQKGLVFFAADLKGLPYLGFLNADNQLSKLYESPKLSLYPEDISVAQEIKFKTAEGGQGFAWYYPPQNKNFIGPTQEKPPLIVKCHGGPTSFASCSFSKGIQFWTSRGYALVDVNYGGSTGYGRQYRERLRQKWGEVDVSDCVAVVQALSAQSLIDPKRVAIRGGSAGGYTTLAALTFTQNIFTVGASYYGVSELEALAKETHKLESRYMDQLVGPYPEALTLYKERSPLEHTEKLNCPIIFFQGEEDKVVPANQSEFMYQALKKKGIPTEYHLYPQEGHGFRQSKNVQHSLKSEHAFYARFFHFEVDREDALLPNT